MGTFFAPNIAPISSTFIHLPASACETGIKGRVLDPLSWVFFLFAFAIVCGDFLKIF